MSSSSSAAATPNRLPQDKPSPQDPSHRIDLSSLVGTVEQFDRAHAEALSRGDFDARVEACWGLVARGDDSLDWVRRELAQEDDDRIEDAAGVLLWIGASPRMVPELSALLDCLSDGPAADVLAAVIDSVTGPEPAPFSSAPVDELFDGRLAAFTGSVLFVNAPLDDVAREGKAWLTELGGRAFSYLDGQPLAGMLDHLEPWAIPSWKQLWVATDSNWTAIFSQGSDIYTHVVVAKRLECEALRVKYSPRIIRDERTVSHGDRAFWFEYADGSKRTIQASYQSRWDWDLRGQPLAFEDIESYSAKRITDRFTFDHLTSYCRALGIRFNDPGYYHPRGVLVEEDTRGWRRPRQLSSVAWLEDHR